MKIFLSTLETNGTDYIIAQVGAMKWNLCSYFYIRSRLHVFEKIMCHSEEMMVDSGAHSFQNGKKVDWEKYTREYANFIRRYDNPKILGYFEMDVDNIIGYTEVLKLRSILEKVSDKIIPVWHKNRGVSEYEKMCAAYAGRIIAISGFKNSDIIDEQYLMFVQKAWSHNCKIHCLGMTRREILNVVPFDYVDSGSWKIGAVNGRLMGKKISRQFSKEHLEQVLYYAYLSGMEMQRHYYEKWRKVNAD